MYILSYGVAKVTKAISRGQLSRLEGMEGHLGIRSGPCRKWQKFETWSEHEETTSGRDQQLSPSNFKLKSKLMTSINNWPCSN